eukprot:TRINITY_DN4554_c0_g5_i1.p1 TRINITY_DN4554_c0_g5~~TRINITY_DN4554_c0_g5_i1.p1  ORF type:complete len:184 (+),score=28.61 TRINITY_DN4554_c0_g5_i1:79-630(+)
MTYSTHGYIQRRRGKYGSSRGDHLQQLTTEFQDTTKIETKEQILANLANFSYDPINYEHFYKLNLVDLFLDCLEEKNQKMIEFAIGGLCNCALDPKHASTILENDGLPLIVNCLSSTNPETVMSAMTTLYFLIASRPDSKTKILTTELKDCLNRYAVYENLRISNLAKVFLEDYYGERFDATE